MPAFGTHSYDGKTLRVWTNYVCTTCGGVLLACADGTANPQSAHSVDEIFPAPRTVDEAIPEPARRYLTQSQDSLHAPDGAVMLAASAVDAMLKAEDYREGSLYARITKAAEDHAITADMAKWAHRVRLEANDRRHADVERPHATSEEAEQAVEFTTALAQFLFVLPSRVTRGLKEAEGKGEG